MYLIIVIIVRITKCITNGCVDDAIPINSSNFALCLVSVYVFVLSPLGNQEASIQCIPFAVSHVIKHDLKSNYGFKINFP